MPETFPKSISKKYIYAFSVSKFGLYYISITSQCGSTQDLRVEIDNFKPREIPPKDKPQYYDTPPAWNGTHLKSLKKTVIFILLLSKGKHALTFVPKNGATINRIDYKYIKDSDEIVFKMNTQAEEGNRRPWYTFVLVNIPLRSIGAEATTKWHFLDGDDMKLIIDGKVEKNSQSILHKNWSWSARPWHFLAKGKKEYKEFTPNLPSDLHYIELWADKTPILHQVNLNLGPYESKQVEDPRWTGDFSDDTDQIILARALFGEARNTLVPDSARIAIGWVIRNRVESKRWGEEYFEVITQPLQFSAFNENDPNRIYVENPIYTKRKIDINAWEHAYDIAGKILTNQLSDPTNGANHYFDNSINTPDWAQNEKPKLTISYTNKFDTEGTIFFYKL